MNTTEQPNVNRVYKDRLFRFIFNDKKELLVLYNAINGTNHSNPNDITIKTMDNVIYMSMKNDVSFLISGILNLYEHQSTWNPNMPYRNLIYTVDLLKGFVEQQHMDIYGSRQLELPTPQAIVFYNGNKKVPEKSLLRLSDSFKVKLDENYLELKIKVLNINYGQNKDLMAKCKRLKDYSIFIYKVRCYAIKMNTLEKAVDKSISECIKENVLSDILSKHRGEVLNMILTEYDEQAHIANEKKWSYEDGIKKGVKTERDSRIQLFIKDSLEDGIEEKIIIQKLKKIFLVDQKQAKEYINNIKNTSDESIV